MLSEFDDVFEGIAAANPDLGGGESLLTLRMGGEVVSVAEAEFERLWRGVADALLGDGVYVHAWVPVCGHPLLVQLAVAHSAYKWAVLSVFDTDAVTVGRVFASVQNFFKFIEGLKEAARG